jgi:DNA-binding CsgD family transcriptional regulator
MGTKPAERTRSELVRLCHRGLEVPSFAREAVRVLRKAVHFDGCCWLTLDPATFLPTTHITMNSLKPEDVPRLAENEFLEEDVNKFAVLARSPRRAASLIDATDGAPGRSARYRNLLSPNGFGDELRASFLLGASPWGAAAFYRVSARPGFEPPEVALLTQVSKVLAEGIRRAILTAAVPTDGTDDAPGLILLGPGATVEAITPAAERWLRDLMSPLEGALPQVVNAVAYRAQLTAQGGAEGLARARVPTATGSWLVLHGSAVGDPSEGRAAVIIEPARSPEIAPLIVEAYGLSAREREVTQLVIQGLSTDEIAGRLFLSPYTVQDHLKAVFDKVGVRSRRELVAHVFFHQYVPRLQSGAPLAANGWFAGAGTAPDTVPLSAEARAGTTQP